MSENKLGTCDRAPTIQHEHTDICPNWQPSGPVAPEPTSVYVTSGRLTGERHAYCPTCGTVDPQAVAPAGGETPEQLAAKYFLMPMNSYNEATWSHVENCRAKCANAIRESATELRAQTALLESELRSAQDACLRLATERASSEKALRLLTAEVSALTAFDQGVRSIIGNTNWSVLQLRKREAEAALAGAPNPQPVHPSEIHAAKLGAKLNAANAALEKMRYDWNCAAKGEDDALRACRALKAEHGEEKKSLIASFLEAQNEALRLKRELREVGAKKCAEMQRLSDGWQKAGSERDALQQIRARTWEIIDELAQPWQSMTNTQWAMLRSLLNDDVDKIVAGAPSVEGERE